MSNLALAKANNQVATPEAIMPTLAYTKDQVELIKRTVAKGATDDELKMFTHLARTYDLDPFLKEIWFIKRVKKINRNGSWDYPRLPNGQIDYSDAETVIMTSRDGYLKAAQRDADFQGLISFAVREGDIFEIDAEQYKVTHKFGAKRGPILGAWARCDRQGRRPSICYVDFKEYNSPNSTVWKSYPSAMIQKVAEVFVLRRQFNINGLVAQEEMKMRDAEINLEPEQRSLTPKAEDIIPPAPQAKPEEPKKAKPEPVGQAQAEAPKAKKNHLQAAMEYTGLNILDVKEISIKAFGKNDLRQLSKDEQDKLFKYMQRVYLDEITIDQIGNEEQAQEGAAPEEQQSELTEKQLKRLFTLANLAKVPSKEAKGLMESMYGVTSTKQLTKKQYDEMCEMFEQQAADGVPF